MWRLQWVRLAWQEQSAWSFFFLAISEAIEYSDQVLIERLVFVLGHIRTFKKMAVSFAQIRVQQFGLATNDDPTRSTAPGPTPTPHYRLRWLKPQRR